MIRRLFSLAVLAWTSAQAADLEARFWGDALPLPSIQSQREQADRARLWVCPAVSGADVQKAMGPAIRSIQEALAGMSQDDPARAALQRTLDSLKGKAPPPTPVLQPVASALTFVQALARTRAWLNAHEAAGLHALNSRPEGSSEAMASAFALQASLAGRPEAALAGLLFAHTLNPKNADTLVNMGGVLVTLGLPAEALAMLREAQRLGIAPGGAMGVPVQAVALNNTGRALIKLGQFSKAAQLLNTALTLAPTLAEANQNLAPALLCQGKTDDAVRYLRLGARRAPAGSEAARALPTGPEVLGSSSQPSPSAQRAGESHVAAGWVFDLSHGQDFTLPDLKIAPTPGGMVALLEQYRKVDNELSERSIALARQGDAVAAQLRDRHETPPATAARRGALWSAIISSHDEPPFRAMDRRTDQLEHEVSTIWGDFWHCEGGCRIAVINQQAHGDQQVFRSLCVPQLQAAHERWRSAMHAYAHDLGASLNARYHYETALAANYSDPLWHQRAALHTQEWVTIASSMLAHHAALWASDIKAFEEVCLEEGPAPVDASPVSGPLLVAPPELCKQLVGKFTTSISIGVVDASFSCDKASLKLAPSGLLTAFTKVDLDTSAAKWKTTLILGLQGGGGLKEVMGLGVKASVGTYVSLTRDGVTDFGMIGDVKSSIGIPLGDALPVGQVKVGESAKAISVRWSFVTGDTEFDLAH